MSIGKDKRYQFPDDLESVNYQGFLLLISPSNGNWIVIENDIQVEITRMLSKGCTIEHVYEQFPLYLHDVDKVVKELEGRHFCESMMAQDVEFTLRIYLTNRCNLRCKHCFVYAGNQLDDELSYDEIIDLLIESKKHGCNKVIFTGGEVVLKEHFMEILRYAHNLDLYVQVLTNGMLWNDSMIKEASNYIDEIQVSIDGFDENTNSYIRGAGAFSKSLEAVAGFANEGKSFVSVIITPLYDFITKYKDKYIQFGKELVNRFGSERFLVIYGKELLDGRSVKADIEKNKFMSKSVDEIYEEVYQNAELTTFVVNHRNNRLYMNCGYGGLTVNSNGDFYFCGQIHAVRCYGNIRNVSFHEIMKIRKCAREKTYVDNIIPCKDCDVRLICGGGCRVSNTPQIAQIDLVNSEVVFKRECLEEYKNNIYRLMIESSEYLYY